MHATEHFVARRRGRRARQYHSIYMFFTIYFGHAILIECYSHIVQWFGLINEQTVRENT